MSQPTADRKTLGVLALALAFGVVMGLLKGNSTGLRGEVGNLSAPWLLVGFLAGVKARDARRGALLGLSATVLALVGFYAMLTIVLSGHLGGGGYPVELRVKLEANRVYFVWGVDHWTPYVVEAVVGLLILWASLVRAVRHRGSAAC